MIARKAAAAPHRSSPPGRRARRRRTPLSALALAVPRGGAQGFLSRSSISSPRRPRSSSGRTERQSPPSGRLGLQLHRSSSNCSCGSSPTVERLSLEYQAGNAPPSSSSTMRPETPRSPRHRVQVSRRRTDPEVSPQITFQSPPRGRAPHGGWRPIGLPARRQRPIAR